VVRGAEEVKEGSVMDRRQFVQAASAASVLGASAGCASVGGGAGGKVVVVGYGGATAAKYIRMWSDGQVEVTLVEPGAAFVSCPISNLVLGGSKQMADITTPYDNLARRHGVRIVQDRAAAIDADKRQVRLASGGVLPYDRLVLSPGVDFMWDQVPGLKAPGAQDRCCTPGRPARRPWRCAASSRPCPTAACSPSASRWRPTAARPGRTSAPARWRTTSSRPSPSPRC
jgi:hypothetical protein